MVAIPTIEEEDAKRPCRERENLVGERTRIAKSDRHQAFQRFRLRKNPLRKPFFCKDFCEEGRRHNITPMPAAKTS